jgi:hypothetical protein
MTKPKPKKKAIVKPFIEYIQVSAFPISVAFTTSEELFVKEMGRLGVSAPPKFVSCGSDATTHTLEDGDGNVICVVCIKKQKGTVAQINSLIAHEAVHCWQETRRSMREDEPSDEFEAYMIQHYTRRMIEEYNK